MVLKKKKRTPTGKLSLEKEYPKITFDQAIDLVVPVKSAEGLRPRTLVESSLHFQLIQSEQLKLEISATADTSKEHIQEINNAIHIQQHTMQQMDDQTKQLATMAQQLRQAVEQFKL